MSKATPSRFLDRLEVATNAHDLDALVDCFTDDYALAQPAHPSRSFTGSAQVRANWQQIFAAVPDLHARVTAQAVDGAIVWSEWDLEGRRLDGAAHRMRGVMLFGLNGDRAEWGRFYLEPVDHDMSLEEALRAQLRGDPP